MNEVKTKNVLPIHLTGMENIKGQQAINSILDSLNNEMETHQWTITTQEYTELKFEKYLESGATLQVDQKPKTNIPIVGTHNNRKVYIGDLDVLGNLNIVNMELRDNITTTAKSWEVTDSIRDRGDLQGDWWNSETFNVGIREPLSLQEVASIPNDIGDPVYGSTIYNKESTSQSYATLDTKTFEKTEYSYNISYPTVTTTDKYGHSVLVFSLAKWLSDGEKSIGAQSYFPQITTLNAKACWAPGQYYGVFDWTNGSNGKIKLVSYTTYATYEDFYNAVAAYPDLRGASGRGIMIPSWRAIKNWYDKNCKSRAYPIITRRFISEEFDKRNSGIVKVDVAYRI